MKTIQNKTHAHDSECFSALNERFSQEHKEMMSLLKKMQTVVSESKQCEAQRAEENKTYNAALRRVRRAAKKDGYRIVQGRDGFGLHGLRLIDTFTNSIIAGENFDVNLETIAGWYGIKL